MTQLIATQDFTDKQGQQHKKDERFQAANDQEAQEYVSQGKAKKEEGAGAGATGSQPQREQRESR